MKPAAAAQDSINKAILSFTERHQAYVKGEVDI